MTDWSHLLFTTSIYALGFMGVLAITLLPLRTFLVLRNNSHHWHKPTGKAVLLTVVATAVAAIALSAPLAARVFRCLTETYCGPSIASGWLYLAYIGAFYLGFEVVSNFSLLVARKGTRVAP